MNRRALLAALPAASLLPAAAFVRADTGKWTRTIRQAGIGPE